MNRLTLLTALLAMAAFAAVPASAAGSSCSLATIDTPSLGGLIGVGDTMNGVCTSSLPGGWKMQLNMQFEEAGTWHYDTPSYTEGTNTNGTYHSLDAVWADITPNCAYNWRAKGFWQDSTGATILSLFRQTLHKSCQP